VFGKDWRLQGKSSDLVTPAQRASGWEPLSGSAPDSFAGFTRSEIVRRAEIVRNSGARPEMTR